MSTSLNPSLPAKQNLPEVRASVGQQGEAVRDTALPAFRQGEIVRGTILEIVSPQAVKMELPSGVVVASVVSEQLQRGDALLFQIAEVLPKPVLRVHSVVTSGRHTTVSETDIVRMLGQSANPITLEVARVLSRMKAAISTQDMEEIVRGTIQLLGNATLEEKIEIVAKMRDAGIPLEPKFYTMMESLFLGGRNISSHLATLKNTSDMPSVVDDILSSLWSAIEKPFTSVRDVVRRLSFGNNPAEASVYSLLGDVAQHAAALGDSPTATAVQHSATALMDTIEAQQLYNVFALQHNAMLVFHVLFPIRGELVTGKLEVEPMAYRDERDAPQAFRVSTEMSALGEVTASGFAMKKTLSVTLLADSPDSAAFLEQYHSELADNLRRVGFVLQSLHIRTKQEHGGDSLSKAMRHVNLVV